MSKTNEITQEKAFKPSIIHVETTANGKLAVQTKNVGFDDLLRMLIPVIVQSAKRIYEVAERQETPNVPAMTPATLRELKLTMYDTMNIAFSNALDAFAPDIEARPNLTADAIIKAQNQLLEEEMKKAGYNPSEKELKEAFEGLVNRPVEIQKEQKEN
jgi:hypothetical protein